jgi:hypothetical protein
VVARLTLSKPSPWEFAPPVSKVHRRYSEPPGARSRPGRLTLRATVVRGVPKPYALGPGAKVPLSPAVAVVQFTPSTE